MSCCHWYGGRPTEWLEEPKDNLIAAFLEIAHIRDFELLQQRAYANLEASKLRALRANLEHVKHQVADINQALQGATPEQRKAHDSFVKRHNYVIDDETLRKAYEQKQ